MSERVKGILASAIAVAVVTAVLSFVLLHDVRALADEQRSFVSETRQRSAAAQERWQKIRDRDDEFHAQVLKDVRQLTDELRAYNERLESVEHVTPVQAIRDRARVAHDN